MWVLKKGNKTKNTFKKEVKEKLVKEGWKIVTDTLEEEKKDLKTSEDVK